jgi:transposase
MCKANKAVITSMHPVHSLIILLYCKRIDLTVGSDQRIVRYIRLYIMTQPSSPKQQTLKAAGTFNPRAKQVSHPLFQESDFFDPRDLLQLKYETLRALQAGDLPIAKAAQQFGLSRPTIYQAQSQFGQEGLEGLLPRKRGPKQPHKLTSEVLAYLRELAAAQPPPSPQQLARALRQRFRLKVHPRTIEKALHTKAKKGLPTSS